MLVIQGKPEPENAGAFEDVAQLVRVEDPGDFAQTGNGATVQEEKNVFHKGSSGPQLKN